MTKARAFKVRFQHSSIQAKHNTRAFLQIPIQKFYRITQSIKRIDMNNFIQ